MIAPILTMISPSAAAARRAAIGLNVDEQMEAARSVFGRYGPHVYLLLLRYAVVNLVAVALAGAAWLQGWVEVVLAADGTRLVVVIFGVFLAGLAICTSRVWRVSWELNQANAVRPHPGSRAARYLELVRGEGRGADSRALAAAALRGKLIARIGLVRHLASTLVLLGLIGTVIGFIIALSGVKPDLATEVTAIAPMITTLISGMSVALYTTLVGAVLNIWLMANYRMLATGTANLLAAIVERGEADAGR